MVVVAVLLLLLLLPLLVLLLLLLPFVLLPTLLLLDPAAPAVSAAEASNAADGCEFIVPVELDPTGVAAADELGYAYGCLLNFEYGDDVPDVFAPEVVEAVLEDCVILSDPNGYSADVGFGTPLEDTPPPAVAAAAAVTPDSPGAAAAACDCICDCVPLPICSGRGIGFGVDVDADAEADTFDDTAGGASSTPMPCPLAMLAALLSNALPVFRRSFGGEGRAGRGGAGFGPLVAADATPGMGFSWAFDNDDDDGSLAVAVAVGTVSEPGAAVVVAEVQGAVAVLAAVEAIDDEGRLEMSRRGTPVELTGLTLGEMGMPMVRRGGCTER